MGPAFISGMNSRGFPRECPKEDIKRYCGAAVASPPASDASVQSDKQKILEWVDRNGSVNVAQISGILHCGRTRAFRVLREMRESGLLMPVVGHRGEYYCRSK